MFLFGASRVQAGVLHRFTVPSLRLEVCDECNEIYLDDSAEHEIEVAMRLHLSNGCRCGELP